MDLFANEKKHQNNDFCDLSIIVYRGVIGHRNLVGTPKHYAITFLGRSRTAHLGFLHIPVVKKSGIFYAC